MKTCLYSIVLGFAALLVCNSCDDKETTPPEVEVKVSLEVTAPAEATHEADDVTFDLFSNVEWEIAAPTAEWITNVAPAKGSGNATITVTLAENPVQEGRSTTLTVTGGELTREVTVSQKRALLETEKKLVDRLVGEWLSSGDWVQELTPSVDRHIVTIEKIDDTTVRIIDLMGAAQRWSNMTSEQDTFTATVDNEACTISIAAQPIEPTFDLNGWPIYLCRFMNDYSAGWRDNWMVGFENIPVSTTGMIINFGNGGWQVGNWGGKPARATFIPLSQDPDSDKIYGYNWFFSNTVWTKQ